MARPVKADADKRARGVTVWLTPADHAALVEKARASGTSLSDFMHRAALRRPLATRGAAPAATAIPFALANELRRIGVNLNQLTRHTYLGLDRADEIGVLARELRLILAEIRALLDNAQGGGP